MDAAIYSQRLDWETEPNELTRMLRAKRRLGCEIMDLRNLNPTTAGFDYPTDAIADALAEAARQPYEPDPLGLLAARQAVAAYYAARGQSVDPRDICLTASTSEAYAWLFQLLTDPGDPLQQSFSYPLIAYLAKLAGLRLDAEMRDHARPRLGIRVSPDMPGGACLTADRLDAWRATRPPEAPVILDEVFADYPLDLASVPRFAAQRDFPAFVLNGLSKVAGLPQMKLGWIIVSGPDAFRAQAMERLELIADTFLSVSGPVQHAAADLLALADPIQTQIRDRCRANLAALRRHIAGCSAVSLGPVEGGWCAALALHALPGAEDTALDLLEQADLQVLPGDYFALPDHLILSLITPPAAFNRGVAALVSHLSRRSSPPCHVRACDWDAAQADATALRRAVFIVEQGIDPAIEMDGRDPDCLHVLAHAAGVPIGTGRLLPDGRIGRLAVLPAWRGRGVGSALLAALLDAARRRGDARIYLHAQVRAIGLYRRAGFIVVGDEFQEAGIPHIEMEYPVHP